MGGQRYGGAEVNEFDGGAPSMAGESMTARARQERTSVKKVQNVENRESIDVP